MPLGRTSRNSKRPSSSSASYTSTLTTIVVVAFCVLAVWMLTSDTIVSPQFSGGGGTTTPTDTTDKLQLDKPQQQEKPATTTNSDATTAATVDTATTTVEGDKKEEGTTASRTFQDSQGDLPRDALRNEDQTKEDNDLNKKDDENTVGVVEKTNQEEGKSVGGGDVGGKLVEENAVVAGGEDSGVENNGGAGGLEEPKSNGDQRENEAGGDGGGVAAEEVVNADVSGGGEDQNQQEVTDNGLGDDNNKELPSEESSTTTILNQQQQQQTDNNGGQVVPEDRDNNNIAAGDANNTQQDNNDQANNNVAESGKTDQSNSDQAKQQDTTNKLEDTNQDSSEQKAATETNGDNNNDEDNHSSNKSNSEPQQKPPDEQQRENNRDTKSNHKKQQSTTTKQETTPTTDDSTDSREEASTTTTQNLSTKEQQQPKDVYVVNISSSQPKQQLKPSTQDTKPTSDDDKTPTTLPNSGIPKESQESKAGWSTQAANSLAEKVKVASDTDDGKEDDNSNSMYGYSWKLCNVTARADYIPCLDNTKAIKKLRSTKQYQHRERHCPENSPTCLVPTPNGYKTPITWPTSRDKIWFNNVPHTGLAAYKGHQNWVKVDGEYITFPGGGTQFIHGALHYIDFINKAAPNIAWGRHTRVVLDVGCGVASFGGFLFDRDVLTMSFAPKDEHEAQVQFALERGIPAISAVMGSQRLPFPARVFDLVHCARCRVPWHMEGGRLLLELNRVLRPGGHFVWSATPVYQKLPQDVEIWEAMTKLTAKLCWQLVTIQRDTLNKVAAAIYRKPTKNECYDNREEDSPPLCKTDDDPNASWYVPIQGCMHRIPVSESERGTKWPPRWPKRLITPPYWLNKTQMGIYGKPAPEDFTADSDHWRYVVKNSYLKGLGISWEDVRNVMDMRAAYGGFAAALRDHKIWVMNVVNVNAPDTLPIIYERGLFGIYHDWCESFSTYPRTYDLLHADHLFSQLKKRCKLVPVMAEVDRIVRPGGKLIVRDESTAISEVENILKSLRWEVHLTFSKDQEGILSAQKSDWRPTTIADSADS